MSALLAGACTSLPPPPQPAYAAAPPCSTPAATIAFDFEGASQSRCIIKGEREFTILVGPEHAPPINPSAWYAFRYDIDQGDDVTVSLEYLAGSHRYPPKLQASGKSVRIDAEVSENRNRASFDIPPGSGRVSGQEIFASERYSQMFNQLRRYSFVDIEVIGHSLGGRPIDAVRMGRPSAPNLIVLLGRAHPPEVSGAVAMEAFLDELALLYAGGDIDADNVQILAVPLLNPDGVARGHWRANLGGIDLNRDWGNFSQPETRAVGEWLDRLEPAVSPIAMIDFHSTRRNLFYVQGPDETDARQEQFLNEWLGQMLVSVDGYPFTIERRNANPGSGTSKNWFHSKYGIPAYTYEVGDNSDRMTILSAARTFAGLLPPAVSKSLLDKPPPRSR